MKLGTVLFAALVATCFATEHAELKLLKYIERQTVDPAALPPRPDQTTPIKVSYGLSITYIRELVDSGKGYADLTLSSWDNMKWTDPRLTWSPEEFGGLTKISIPASRIWTPDMYHYLTLGHEQKVDHESLAVVMNSGDVLLIPPSQRSTRCRTIQDGKYECKFSLGSWTHDGFSVDLDFWEDKKEMLLDHFEEDLSAYFIESNTAVYERKIYECCPEPYPTITYTIVLCDKKSK